MSKGSGHSISPLPRTAWGYVSCSVLLTTCAMLSKEQGIVVVGVCATYDIILHWEIFWGGIFRFIKSKHKAAETKKNGNGGNDKDEVLLKEIGDVIEGRNGINRDTLKQIKASRRNQDDWNASSAKSVAKRLGM